MNSQDFTKFHIKLNDKEVAERVRIWAACNVVAQRLQVTQLDPELELHLKIEIFRNNVSRSMASNVADPVEDCLCVYINRFHIIASRLHLHAFFLFDESEIDSYTERIIKPYFAAASLIQLALDVDKRFKIITNAYFAAFLDVDAGKKLFNASVTSIRKMPIANNDLPGRLGDVLAYLWTDTTPNLISRPGKAGLRVVFDSLWRWRQQFRAHGSGDPVIDQDNEDYCSSTDQSG
ncbi:uncharacterized protein K441DRAFT_686946 [Cenococcum geophilum 1.58]|uniref:uncharacterized protein n=1 Tax=Cenococcum geophilum 1.58 TaxID=794803 RepID=UPI00358F61F5|nr:hypothetical protein K441DRAFT_686946 [Cenococcum geophilum 1.58]